MRLSSLPLLLGLLAAAIAPLGQSQEAPTLPGPDTELAVAPTPVRDALIGRRSQEALDLLEDLDDLRAEDRDLWHLLRVVAHEQLATREDVTPAERTLALEAALAAADAGLAARPEGAWAQKLAFRRAKALRGLRRFEEAEQVFEAAARAQRSPERQGRLAEALLVHARRLSEESRPGTPDEGERDLGRARELFGRVLELDAPATVREEALFARATCSVGLGQSDQAAGDWRAYLALEDAPRADEARVRLGRALLAGGKARPARQQFEDALAALAETDASLPWRAAARLGIAEAWRAENQPSLAGAAFERFLEAHPGHEQAQAARFARAALLRDAGEGEAALTAFRAVLDAPAPADIPEERREEVLAEDERLRQEALFQLARVLTSQDEHDRARDTYAEYTRRHPTGARWTEAQQGIVDSAFARGESAREREDFPAAREAYRAFLTEWPLDGRVRETELRLAQLWMDEAAIAAEDGTADEDALRGLRERAVEEWRRIARRYPGSEEASRALHSIGTTLETLLDDLEGAVEAYRACTFGGWSGSAAQRRAAMTNPSVQVATEQTWRSNEDAVLRLDARNHERVRVRLHRLDLEAYFRKHLTHQRIEDLDLDLIAPDQEFEVALEDYRPFAPLRQDVVLPVEGSGVWAVVVEAGESRATTLVVRSDLEVILKSSRREVFVYAQDMRAGTPAAGARALVALPGQGEGGGALLRELVTGADGTARLALDELRSADGVRLFASRAEDVASNGLTLGGLGLAQGLQARGTIWSDRAAYRPGESVGWRGIARDVRRGSYTFEEGQEVRVEVFDPSGRRLRRFGAPLSRFGTVSGSFELPEEAPTGRWRLSASTPYGLTFQQTFQVAQYELAKVELTVEVDRPVAYRGEEVEATATARWYYGAPLADAELVWSLPDGREAIARTDGEGRASISIATRDFAEDQRLTFRATLSSEGVSSSASTLLATRALGLELDLPTRTLLAGETFRATIRARAPDGSPAQAEEVDWVLLRREGTRRGYRDLEVLRGTGTTLPYGDLGLDLACPDGGDHVLRATTTDRFGNPIRVERTFFVSGDGDRVKLRILAEQTEASVGDALDLELVNRAGEGLALVTIEGETILSHRLVELAAGRTPLPFEALPEHFPNVVVSAAMMERGAFHEARLEVEVARALTLTVEAATSPVAPGDEAVFDLRATDSQGAPVEAELSLVAVDEALIARWGERTPDLVEVFAAGTRRDAGLRTTTSCTFRYEGRTREIDRDILAEGARLEAQVAFAADQEALLSNLDALGYVGGLVDKDAGRLAERKQVRRGLRPGAPPAPEEEFEEDAFNSAIGIGGGAGGKFGGRFGGRRSLSARGGSAAYARTPGELNGDTLVWIPDVVTDAEGRAQVRVRVPERSTSWRLVARGVGANTLVGGAESTFTTRSSVHLELRVPAGLTAGDRPAPTVLLHDAEGRTGACTVTLEAASDEERRTFTRTIELEGAGVQSLAFPELEAVTAGALRLTATARMEDADVDLARTSEERAVRPYGLRFVTSAGGPLDERVDTLLELPTGRTYRDRTLRLRIGTGLSRLLLDEALGLGPAWRCGVPIDRGSARAQATELLGVAGVLRRALEGGGVAAEELETLRERGLGLVAALATTQLDDGGWAPWQGGRRAEVRDSARCLWALAEARRATLALPDGLLDRSAAHLTKAFAQLGQQDDATRAVVQHALASAGRGDFAALNRLHRERASLSPVALAATALGLTAHGSMPMAADLCALIEQAAGSASGVPFTVAENPGWALASDEQVALSVLALQAAAPSSARIEPALDWLLGRRPFGRARGLVLLAGAGASRAELPEGETVRVRVAVEGRPAQEVLVEGGRTAELSYDLADVRSRRIGLEVEVSARGGLLWAAQLEGFSEELGEPRKGPPGMRVAREQVLPDPPRVLGRAVPVGFSVVQRFEDPWTNEVQAVEVGDGVRQRVSWWRDGRRQEDGALALTIPIPAGLELGPDGVRGGVGRPQLEPGEVTVVLDPRSTSGAVEIDLLARHAGSFRALPATLRSLQDASGLSLGAPLAFRVVRPGVELDEAYRPTPDELYYAGKALFEAGEREAARARLAPLFSEFEGVLREEILVDTAHKLLLAAIDAGDSEAIVDSFELIKEKGSSITIPFDEVVAIGDAYRRLGEHERALLIFRATLLETYGKDLKVAGALEELGEFAASMELLQELWLAYPDFGAVQEAHLTLADKLIAMAPRAHRDPSCERAGWRRAGLVLAGTRHLDRFLALHPTDPLAADAALAVVSARLAVEDHLGAAELAQTFAQVFTAPRYADAFVYSGAVAQWWLGREDEAREALQRIATSETVEDGRRRPSENRDLALYILGQIHHARRELAQAATYYERVRTLFADAAEALAGFRERHIALDEVTTVRTGEPVELELRHKNVEEAELLVYGVDLMTLYLREKDLSQITEVNLSGIAPTLRATVPLEAGDDLREHETTTSLELTEPGAYLVIVRGGELFTSGLVLVSDLELEVAEERGSGRVRVQALGAEDGTYLRGVDVRVVGSADQAFQRGVTDPRGLYIADGIAGSATVVARLDGGHYAFHRGAVALGQPEQQQQLGRELQQPQTQYFKNVIEFNDVQNRGRARNFQNELQKDRAGVRVEQVK